MVHKQHTQKTQDKEKLTSSKVEVDVHKLDKTVDCGRARNISDFKSVFYLVTYVLVNLMKYI